MWDRKELKQKGLAAFKANYWKCVVVAILLAIFVAGTTVSARSSVNDGMQQVNSAVEGVDVSTVTEGGSTQFVVNGQNYDSAQDAITAIGDAGAITPEQAEALNNAIAEIQNDPEGFKSALGAILAIVVGAIAVIGIVASLLRLLVFNPIEIGCRGFFTRNTEAPAEIGEVKSGFSPYGRNVLAMLLRDLFLCLWTLLFIVPGLIKYYSYRMVPYILADDPEIGAMEAINRSRSMMNGNKWKAFVLDLSFLGWDLLSVVTLGLVGIFYVNPYKYSTGAELYQVLKNQ